MPLSSGCHAHCSIGLPHSVLGLMWLGSAQRLHFTEKEIRLAYACPALPASQQVPKLALS